MSRARRTRVGGLPREIRAVDPGSWDRAAIVAAMHDWAAFAGRAPRAHEWSSTGLGPGPGSAHWLADHPRWPSAGAVVYHFGSWSDALRAAGLPTLSTEHDLPRRERVATAVALRAAGESVRSIAEQLGVHLRTAHRYLAARTCPGCGGPVLSGERCLECAPGGRPTATREQIVAALRAWTAAHGAPPREPDWTNASLSWREAWPGWAGAGTVLRVFGSWNAALEAAHLPTRRYAWAREEALERLAAWARTHGRPPTIAEANADSELPGLATCEHLYGSWNAALRAARLTPQHEAHWSEEHVRAVLAEWARWHTRHGRGEPSAASYPRWARQPELPGPVGLLDPAALQRLLERRARRRRPPGLARRAPAR